MTVPSAALSGQTILITGLAGLLAGACSMATGERISVQSSRGAAARQLEIAADELDTFPDEEREELRLIYRAKALPDDEAAATVGIAVVVTGRSAMRSGMRRALIGWAAAVT